VSKLLSISLLLVLLLPGLVKVTLVVNFSIHREDIAKFLCVDRDKPKSNCNGKCYLMQQLNKIEKQEEKELPKSITQLTEILSYVPREVVLTTQPILSKRVLKSVFEPPFLYKSSYVASVFRPPWLSWPIDLV